ncbi:sugar-binding domain-containing protein [Marinilabilia rubra]|nr:sugar-binding domain-containing protein [Marinilabilia rubra]
MILILTGNLILGDVDKAYAPAFNDDSWRMLDLPHDWSVEQNYTTDETAGSTGFLPTGIGWYRKLFVIPETSRDKKIHIEFDGIFSNSRVWINGHFLGDRRRY